jgi:NAD(P)H-hydrate epimerase
VVVDALLGTGTKGKLKAPILQMVEYINSLKAFKIAVDVPTGIDSDTGDVLGTAIKADVALTFYKSKDGLEKAKQYAGELIVKGIGLPMALERYAGPGDVELVTKRRVEHLRIKVIWATTGYWWKQNLLRCTNTCVPCSFTNRR